MKSILLIPDPANYNFKEKLFYYLLAGFIITLFVPYPPVLNNIFLGAVFFSGLFVSGKNEKAALLKEQQAYWWMAGFFLWMLLSLLWSVNKKDAFAALGTRIPLLLFPVVFSMVRIPAQLKTRLLLVYAWFTTLAAVCCFVYAVRLFRVHGDTGYLYNDFMSAAMGRQSIYFAMLVNLAIFVYTWFLHTKSAFIRSRPSVIVSIIFLLIVHFFLASRVAMLVLYPVAGLYLLIWIVKGRRWKEGLALLIGLVVTVVSMVKISPKVFNRFKELMYTDYQMDKDGAESHYNMALTEDQWNGANSRLAIWKNGWSVIEKNMLIGTGIGDKKDELFKVYKQNNFVFALRTEKNLHNNYLDVWMSLGLVGLVLFVTGYIIAPLWLFRKRRDVLGTVIIFAFAASLFTEVYMDRSIGCVVLGFVVPFFLMRERKETTEG